MLPVPHGYQERASGLIVKNGAEFLMHDMGMGKTLTCILAMRKVGMPVIVLAPLNAAINTWPDELDKWAPDMTYVVLHGNNKNHLATIAHTFDIVIINFEGLPWWYDQVTKKKFKLKKYFVVWDESSMLKDSTTKRWQILVEAMPIWSSYRVCLSGTPMPNTLQDLWAQYYLLDEGKALCPEYYQFRSRWFDHDRDTFTTSIKPWAEEAIFNQIAPITDRLDGDDYLELPETIHNDIHLELPYRLRKMYKEFEMEFMLEFADIDIMAGSSAVLGNKLRQFLQGGLYGAVEPDGFRPIKMIHDIKARLLRDTAQTIGSPMLAPIQFQFEYDAICKVMKYKVPIIHGKTPAMEGRRLIQEWNKGSIPVLLCHPRSVAYSLNLQFGGYHIFWVALPWEMDLYKQLIRRLRRQGQKSKRVFVHRAIFYDTMDVKVAAALARKDANQERLFKAVTERRTF